MICPSDSRLTVTSVIPLRPNAERTWPSATSTSPSRPGAVKEMSAPAATVRRPRELQASAKHESARVKM
ncbi:hypothetical protein GCM10009868_36300 [Terrabacter aerolatus]